MYIQIFTVIQLLDAFVEVVFRNGVQCTCHGFLDVRNRVKETPLQVEFHFSELIVIGNEKLCFAYDPTTKSQSAT
jgi:hypothetical protein